MSNDAVRTGAGTKNDRISSGSALPPCSTSPDPVVRKRLTEVAQILQVYCRLAELQLTAGGRPRFSEPGEYGLPEEAKEAVVGWTEKERAMETIAAFNKDPVSTLRAME